MNLTVFAGTFNPIHIAHLILAEAVRVSLRSEKILFIPSHLPPHRETALAEAKHRLEMVRLATEDNPAFEVSDIEFKLDGKSYTLNTIKHLYKQYPDITGKINFIIGADAFLRLESWHKPEEFVKLVNFVVLERIGSSDVEKTIENIKLKDLDYTVIEAPIIDISSSYIRSLIKNRESIKYLVTDAVKDYIQSNQLYSGGCNE